MKILITGAGGMVARALIQHCRNVSDDVLAFSREDLDITDLDNVIDTISGERPDAVINCAAFTDVDGSEANPERCFAVNSLGAENLAFASKKAGCSFLTISTDYVFRGDKPGFYTQRDLPQPQSVYGKSKLEGENRVKKTYPRSIVVRTGWLFGVGGTNFLSVMDELLRAGKSVIAIDDASGTPTFAADLAIRLRDLIEIDVPLTFHVANSGTGTSFYEFARKICEFRGYDHKLVKRISSAELKRPAARPRNSSLECLYSQNLGLKPLQHWENSLKEFLNQ